MLGIAALLVAVVVLAVLAWPALDSRTWWAGRDEPRHRDAVDLHGLRAAELRIVGGLDSLTVVAADMGGDLAVATTPRGSRAVPVLELRGSRLTASTREGPGSSPAALTIRLAAGVRWTVSVDAGARRVAIDLGSATGVSAVDVNSGTGELEARLPRPDGVLPLRVRGGAGSVNIHRPDGVPARVTFESGAGSARADSETRQGIPAGVAMATTGWNEATDRLDVELTSGVGALTLAFR